MIGNSVKQADLLSVVTLSHVIQKMREECSGTLQSLSIFRLPGEEMKISIMGSEEKPVIMEDIDLESMKEGFIMAKFDGEKYYSEAQYIWNSDWDYLKTPVGQIEFNEIKKGDRIRHSDLLHFKSQNGLSSLPQTYIELVEKTISFIKKGGAEKVVPARSKFIGSDDNRDLLLVFEDLCIKYPNAFVSLYTSEETGTWIGASPEVLVKTNSAGHFETVAVAGTQNYTGQSLSEVAWKEKEIEEQAFVSRYIINCFKKIRLRDFAEQGPKTVIAGNLLHLKTHFKVNMNEVNFTELGSTMLKLLHPTSAVCGMPKKEAMDFIKLNENLDRNFYSGFLGPVNHKESTNIFVNLRCMEVLGNGYQLYAGAGVTIDSKPEKELNETDFKFETLGKVLNTR